MIADQSQRRAKGQIAVFDQSRIFGCRHRMSTEYSAELRPNVVSVKQNVDIMYYT